MILSDRDILKELTMGSLTVGPFDERTMLQPASIDLQLSKHFKLFVDEPNPGVLDPLDPSTYRMVDYIVQSPMPFVIRRGEFILGSTIQRVAIPDVLVGRLEGKSSLARLGISIHSTAGFIDPGFRGHITLEIKNDAPRDVLLWPGMKVAQLSVHWLSSPAKRPYGSEGLGSKYQDSVNTVESRYHANSGLSSPTDTSL